MMMMGGGETHYHTERRDDRKERDLNDAKLDIEIGRAKDTSLTMGDAAVGEERLQKDLGAADIDAYQKEMEQRYGPQGPPSIDFGRVMVLSITGMLIGVVFGLLMWSPETDMSVVVWGMFLGGLSAGGLTLIVQYIMMFLAESRDPFKKALKARRDALRRMEEEAIERHDEVVYYDAGRSHSRFYRLLMCGHYGKLTSKRVIYSARPAPDGTIFGWVQSFWGKQVETVDYSAITDVSVTQTCSEYLSDVGRVTLHLNASFDDSMVLEERNRCMLALKAYNAAVAANNDGEDLIEPLLQSREIILESGVLKKELEALDDAIAAHEKKMAGQSGQYKLPIVMDPDRNTMRKIIVNDVAQPYSVVDDLSYKIMMMKNKAAQG